MANPFASIVNTVGTLAPGHIVLATEWNTAVGGIYSYINNTLLLGGLNKVSNKGDTYVFDGAALQALAVGSNGQVVMADSTTATGLKFASIVNTTTTLLTTKGDLVTTDGVTLNRLPVGADGQALIARASATNGVQWETPPGVPLGGIILWSGNAGSIPAGYNICDGGTYNGFLTPNMQGLYAVGAGGSNPPASGGLGTLAVNTPGGALTHTHGTSLSTTPLFLQGGSTAVNNVTNVGVASATVKPPYNTLFFIMRTI